MNERLCRPIVYDRAERFCERCCVNGPVFSVHHRLKRSHGGLWTPENCVLLCGTGTQGCHGWVEHHADDAAAQGWHVRSWDEPAKIPVLWRGDQWVYLLMDGSVEHVEEN